MTARLRKLIVAALVLAFHSVVVFPQSSEDKELIRKARQHYYNLRALGLISFEAKLQPNWKVALVNMPQNPVGTKVLNGLHFSMSLDEDSEVTVKHRADVPAPDREMQAGVEQIVSGLNQMITGFVSTWRLFMLERPLPDPNIAFKLEDLGASYLMSYKENAADVVISMTKELAITNMSVSMPSFQASVNPVFQMTDQGYVLVGYFGAYHPISGPGKGTIKVQVDYQDVKGLKLPQKLYIDTVLDGSPAAMELLFSNYSVSSRASKGN